MLGSLTLQNYRAFERYTMTDLRRVNLIVGRNNCGKTSLLEAAYLLATGGDWLALAEVARNRHEADATNGQTKLRVDFSRFFRNGTIAPGASFSVTRAGDSLKVEVVPSQSMTESWGTGKPTRFNVRTTIEIKSEYNGANGGRSGQWAVEADGMLDIDLSARGGAHRLRDHHDDAVFVGCDSLSSTTMNGLWNRVARASREDDVVDFVRLIAPKLRDFRFVVADGEYVGEIRPSVLVGMEKGAARTPLGSEGEGVRRLLGIGLALAQARDATVLIDEVDTGLHYHLLPDFWKALVEGAKRSNSVVFATTHSSDCIRGLARMCEDHQELAGEVSLQKIDRTLDHSIPFHAPEIVTAVEQEIEVR